MMLFCYGDAVQYDRVLSPVQWCHQPGNVRPSWRPGTSQNLKS